MRKMRPTAVIVIVLAAVAAGCSSEDAVIAPAAPAIDTAPPLAPTGLHAADGKRVVKLAWEANTTDLDLAGYRVYRLAFGNAYPLNDDLLTEPQFLDRRPLGLPCGYAVSAVDAAGNESAVVEVRYTPAAPPPDRTID